MDTAIVRKSVKSKTIHLGLWLAIAGFLQTQTEFFALYMTPQEQGVVTMLLGLVVVVLRFKTTVPVSEK